MATPPDPSRRLRIVPLLVAVVLSLGVGGLSFLDGAEPLPPLSVCYGQHFGPLVTALLADPTAPWPDSWAAFFAGDGARDAAGCGDPAILRCPADTAHAGADPLTTPSFALMAGLERDMPPFLLACWEPAVFHVWDHVAPDGRRTRFAAAWLATLGGGSFERVQRALSPGLSDDDARRAVGEELARLVARDRAAVAVAARHTALAAGDADARVAVLAGLTAGDYRTRACAAWAVAKAGARDLRADLRQTWQRESVRSAREEEARALALLGDRAGVADLVAALDAVRNVGPEPGDPAPPHVRRERAHAALVALAGRDLGHGANPDARAAWQAWARRP